MRQGSDNRNGWIECEDTVRRQVSCSCPAAAGGSREQGRNERRDSQSVFLFACFLPGFRQVPIVAGEQLTLC